MRQFNDSARLPTPEKATPTYEVGLSETGFVESEFAFEPYLFHRSEHLATQQRKNPVSIALRSTQHHRIVAIVHLDRQGREASSPTLAPFGGIQAVPHLTTDALTLVLSATENWCRANKVSRLVMKTPPVAYNKKESETLSRAYEWSGFSRAVAHVSHHLAITPTPFIDIIRSSERRRLRKCQRAGFTATIWQAPDPRLVYTFLSESRQRQGYPLSLDFDQLRLLLTDLSRQAQVFVVRDGTKIVSLTVGIRVSTKILYNFCPADNLDYRSYSPMVLLNSFLYEYAQLSGIDLIDLGISLDHQGHEKASLMRFKENLGAQKSEKVTYVKEFY